MKKTSTKKSMKTGFTYFIAATALFAVQFMFYMKGSTVLEIMDFSGWLFFVTSCVSHAACFALVPFLLLFTPFGLFGRWRTGGVLMTTGVSLLSIFIFLNMQVYDIYRFHINGFVINMLMSDGAGEIFKFDTMLYVKEIAFFLLLIAVCTCLWIAVLRYSERVKRSALWSATGIILACTLFAHLFFVYAEFNLKQTVINCKKMIPYYFPLKARTLLRDLGFTPPNGHFSSEGIGTASGEIIYPLHPLKAAAELSREQCPNIVLILIDSWNKRSLTPECMPNTYAYAKDNLWFDNHVSSANRTIGGVFGLFFAIPSYYWDIFDEHNVSPVFIDRMLELGYRCQVYPSAEISYFVPFERVIFNKIKGVNTSTEGATVYERDRRVTENFIADLNKQAGSGQPFFSMLFYDLPHSFELPEDKLTRFTPSDKYIDYTKLNNDTDPTPVFNLYRNCCYQTDIFVGQALKAIEESGVADNTIVIITGDHGQEFNENKKNYWGHPSNFSIWQIGVPLICHFNGNERPVGRRTYRTTHYDIVPTLMTEALGVANPPSDYSMGRLLSDSTSRKWHTMSKYESIVFLLDNDTILEKTSSDGIEITDARLNIVDGYHVNAKEFNAAIKNLNRFLK